MTKKKLNNKELGQGYSPPEYNASGFHCPHCKAYAHQQWYEICKYNYNLFIEDIRLYLKGYGQSFELSGRELNNFAKFLSDQYISMNIKSGRVAFCAHCGTYSVWINEQMEYPRLSTAPLPVACMPKPVKDVYNEARDICDKSPRGACALLRLALELLVKELGENEKNLKKAIDNLVKKGLPEKIKKLFYIVRIIGNNAIHPGKIDMADNPKMLINCLHS